MTPASPTLDIDVLRRWIGREEIVTDTVGPDLVRKFRAMLALPEGPLEPGTPAPRLLHFCLGQPAVAPAGLGRDGHPARGGFLPPVALPRRMWAGGALTFSSDLMIGATVRRRSRIADVALKDGRSGPLCFVTVTHSLDAGGRTVIEERQDLVYRGDQLTAAKPPAPAPAGRHTRAFETSTTTLFRYSALTFNGHRIHYDRRYAIDVEGYRGLVVHGPLQATLMYNFATDLRGSPPAEFSFRGLSPLIDDDPCAMHADTDGAGLRLWTCRSGGPIAMSAEARWS